MSLMKRCHERNKEMAISCTVLYLQRIKSPRSTPHMGFELVFSAIRYPHPDITMVPKAMNGRVFFITNYKGTTKKLLERQIKTINTRVGDGEHAKEE